MEDDSGRGGRGGTDDGLGTEASRAVTPPRPPAFRPRRFRLPRAERETVELRPVTVRRRRATSPTFVIWGLLAVIGAGTLALWLPVASEGDRSTSFLTALFTATSAVCTTGLVVVDTQEHWSLFGEAVILLLMQVGGLGFLVSSTLILMLIGRRLSLRDRLVAREALGEGTLGGVTDLVRRIVLFALVVEGVGAVLLTGYFAVHEPLPVAVWYGLFHAVAAFANAGFDLLGGFRSFSGQGDEPYLLLVVSLLIIIGGISFAVVSDITRRRRFALLALDTKLVLVGTGALLVVGTLGVLVLEAGNAATLGAQDPLPILTQAFFYSSSTRTAGIAAHNLANFRDETLFFLMGLMFIGGAAGSTAGGIKVNTLAVLIAVVVSASKGRSQVIAFGREIPAVVVMRALTAAVLGMIIAVNITLALTVTEPYPLLPLAFEAVSAFGTVGLSTGITPELSAAGKLLLIVAMFAGRIGPLALAVALVHRERPTRVRFPEDAVRIG